MWAHLPYGLTGVPPFRLCQDFIPGVALRERYNFLCYFWHLCIGGHPSANECFFFCRAKSVKGWTPQMLLISFAMDIVLYIWHQKDLNPYSVKIEPNRSALLQVCSLIDLLIYNVFWDFNKKQFVRENMCLEDFLWFKFRKFTGCINTTQKRRLKLVASFCLLKTGDNYILYGDTFGPGPFASSSSLGCHPSSSCSCQNRKLRGIFCVKWWTFLAPGKTKSSIKNYSRVLPLSPIVPGHIFVRRPKS